MLAFPMRLLTLLRTVPAILAASVPLCWPAAAVAQSEIFNIFYTPSGARITTGPTNARLLNGLPRVVTMGSGGALTIATPVRPVVGGVVDVAMTSNRVMTAANAARVLARGLPVLAAVSAAAVLFEAVRCRKSGGTNTFVGANLECDVGSAPASGGGSSLYRLNGLGPTTYYTTKEAACDVVGNSGNLQHGVFTNAQIIAAGQPSYAPPNGQGLCIYYPPTGFWSAWWAFDVIASPSCTSPAVLGADGKCSTGTYVPKTPDQAAAILAPTVAPPPAGIIGAWTQASADAMLEELWGQGIDTNPYSGAESLTGPASVTGAATTTSSTTGGTTTTQTRTPTHAVTYNGNSYTTTTTITTVNGGTTTTVTGAPEQKDTCGLPGTPACKIDETGTPTAETLAGPKAGADAKQTELTTGISTSAQPHAVPWLWGGINLPTGSCSDFVVEGPIPQIASRTLDICGQPWVAFWRSFLAWATGLWTLGYCWLRFRETV